MEPFDPEQTALSVEVAAVRWRAPDGAFAVLAGISEEGEDVVLVGALDHVHEGESVAVEGGWQRHPRHGWRFVAERARIEEPASEQALLAYLGSVKHVGPRGAAWLLECHGPEQVLAAVDRDPERALRAVPGIGQARIGAAVRSWEDQGALRAVRLFLEEHGVPAAVAARIYRAYGPGAIETLRSDPYGLTELDGIGFATADALAQALGTPPDSPGRLDAGLRHALREAESDGHCHLPRAELAERARRLLGADADDRIDELAARGKLVIEGDRVFDPSMHAVETRLARHVHALIDDKPRLRLREAQRPTEGFAPTDAQWAIVQAVLDHRLAILTGGPGTGKCVAPESQIVVDGALARIADVWREHAVDATFDGEGWWATPRRAIVVPTIGEDGQIAYAPVGRLYRQAVRETGRRVTLSDGSVLTMTTRHRLLGLAGWQSDLAAGDWVCVPRQLPSHGGTLDADLVRLLAWQIAEGHESSTRRDGNCLRITQKDVIVLDRLQAAVRRIGEREGLNVGAAKIARPTNRAPYLRIESADYRRFLEAHGYEWGLRSREKKLPASLMQADARSVRLFLREYFAAEGSASASRRWVEITSASPTLMSQLQLLLRRFGVWMRLRTAWKAATNGLKVHRPYIVGAISGPALRRFAIEIGFADSRKEGRLFEAIAVHSNANAELVPVSDLIWALKTVTGLSRHYFGLSSSYFTAGKQPSREIAQRVLERAEAILDGHAEAGHERRIAALTGRAGHRYKQQTREAFATLDRARLRGIVCQLRERINRDVLYVRVKAVETVALDGWVYDLEVPGIHNYVAGGMLCHNTASMRSLVDLVQEERRTVRLCAPTGKAARRLAEITGAQATTIHRLLEYVPGEGFARGEEDPIPGTDVLIVDEASMLSVRLAEALFAAVGPRTHVLLVGDVDQLAPVGPGRVLDDLIESGRVPVVRLTEIFRQAARSLIVRAAHAVNAGQPPPTVAGPGDLRDFFVIERSGPDPIRDEVVALASERLPAHYDLDPRAEVLVVAPMHRGPAGIDSLNAELRARLNADGAAIPGTPLRIFDRVIQSKNNHERELMNGEMGVIEHHDSERDRVLLACDDGRRLTLSVSELDTMRLAHAVSIHKAQGSQAPAVVVVLHRGHHLMLTRNLVYTAITRAERVCVVVGERAALHVALGRRDAHTRHTRLKEYLAG